MGNRTGQILSECGENINNKGSTSINNVKVWRWDCGGDVSSGELTVMWFVFASSRHPRKQDRRWFVRATPTLTCSIITFYTVWRKLRWDLYTSVYLSLVSEIRKLINQLFQPCPTVFIIVSELTSTECNSTTNKKLSSRFIVYYSFSPTYFGHSHQSILKIQSAFPKSELTNVAWITDQHTG